MKRIEELGTFPMASAVCETKEGFLCKRRDEIVLLDFEGRLLRRLPYPGFVRKFVLSEDQSLVVPVSGLFDGHVLMMETEAFRMVDQWDFSYDGSVLRDAFSLPDGSFFLFLENRDGTYLAQVGAGKETRFFLKGEGLRYDRAFFAKSLNAVLLFAKEGRLSYLAEGRIVKDIDVPKMNRVLPLGKGNVLLGDAPLGFYLLSGNGKVLRRLDFLLPTDGEKDMERDFLLDARKELCLYFTRSSQKEAFYLFSTKDFELLGYRMKRKKETESLSYDGKRIYLQDGRKIVVSRFVG